MKTIAIIPARYASTRFPGKPLVEINGKPMIWHVYQAARKVREIDDVYIATEDARIAEACKQHGLACLMTGPHHFTGTDRLTECATLVDADFYVNVQGDEPMIDPAAIAEVTRAMQSCTDKTIVATNGYTPLDEVADIESRNVVKAVLTQSNRAMSFSRLPVPFARGEKAPHLRQLGLYCFTRKALALFAALKPGPIERSESVEMLRFVEHDHPVLMVKVDDHSVPVDTPEDLERVRTLMQ